MTTKNKKSLFAKWLENNHEKVLSVIQSTLEDDEKLINWLLCETAPPEILDWFPILDMIHHAGTKNYILVLTHKRLLAIQTKGLSHQVTNIATLLLSEVKSIEERQRPMTAQLVVTSTIGKKTVYKEVDRESAAAFMADFTSLAKVSS